MQLIKTFHHVHSNIQFIFEHKNGWANMHDVDGTCIASHRVEESFSEYYIHGHTYMYPSAKFAPLELVPEELEIQIALGVIPKDIYVSSPIKTIWVRVS